ncbi:MAG: amino acid permease [Bryobacterales bacterium]|nr:amino acid permease [Bryobacterales bacterium]
MIREECDEVGEHTLKRALGPTNLIALGIGAIIGTGIFVLTGSVAAQNSGPAIVLSFTFAGIACAFAGLCYAEFASLIPIAGSAYTYGYATLGELFAWIIGWDLILEYAFGAATVASGWSANIVQLLARLGIVLPPQWIATPGTHLAFYGQMWQPIASLPAGVDAATLPNATAVFNLVAFLVIAVVTTILVIGIQESATVNTVIVFIKVGTVLVFIAIAAGYVLQNLPQAKANWTPFIPPNTGQTGEFGWSGIMRGAGKIFFAYIGFDAVSTAAQEAKNPQKDMPVGILGSLTLCTILYIVTSGLLTGVISYTRLNVGAPIALGIAETGVKWGEFLVLIGTIMGLSTVMLVMLLGQSRVFFSMSRDGLLPRWAGAVHPRFRTPWISSIVVGVFVAFLPAILPIGVLNEMTSIGTLLAFVIVCAGVWVLRVRRPHLDRPFKTPLVPLVPILGMIASFLLMIFLPLATWIRLVIWMIIGMAIYLSYGRKHSRVQQYVDKHPKLSEAQR